MSILLDTIEVRKLPRKEQQLSAVQQRQADKTEKETHKEKKQVGRPAKKVAEMRARHELDSRLSKQANYGPSSSSGRSPGVSPQHKTLRTGARQ